MCDVRVVKNIQLGVCVFCLLIPKLFYLLYCLYYERLASLIVVVANCN